MLLKWTEMNKSCRILKADVVEHKLPVINLAEPLQQTIIGQLATKALILAVQVQRGGMALWCWWEQCREQMFPLSCSTTAASLQRVIPRNRAVISWQLGNNQPEGGKKGMTKGRRVGGEGEEKKKECIRVVAADYLVRVRETSEWKLRLNKVLESDANWTVTKWACSSLPPKPIHMMSETDEKIWSNLTEANILLILNNFLYFHISSALGKANKIKCS